MNIIEAFSANILYGLAELIGSVLKIYSWILIISILITWVQPDPYNPIVMFLRRVSEPYLGWFRRKLPFLVIGAVDISPIVAIMALNFAAAVIVGTLRQLGSGI